jgi:hypothetical protein
MLLGDGGSSVDVLPRHGRYFLQGARWIEANPKRGHADQRRSLPAQFKKTGPARRSLSKFTVVTRRRQRAMPA